MTDMTSEQIEAAINALATEIDLIELGNEASPETLRQALTAIRQLQRGWRGIGTFPVDGEVVMAAMMDHDGEKYVAVDVYKYPPPHPYISIMDGIIKEPIAWMPLPLPPAGDV